MARKNLWFRTLAPALLLSSLLLSGVAAAMTSNTGTSMQTVKTTKKTSGIAKFVLGGSVKAATDATLSIHVKSASKNLSVLVNTDQVLPITKVTKVTQNGKRVLLSSLAQNSKVRVFGTYNNKSKTVNKVRWVKVMK